MGFDHNQWALSLLRVHRPVDFGVNTFGYGSNWSGMLGSAVALSLLRKQ